MIGRARNAHAGQEDTEPPQGAEGLWSGGSFAAFHEVHQSMGVGEGDPVNAEKQQDR